MRTAQRLYEGGYITYMRTDSTTLSETALTAARRQARELYGDEYVPSAPRQYTRKVKNAQEAHEAIRPAGESFRTPGQVASALGSDEFRLYELIWQRTIASQMVDARGLTLTVRISADAAGRECVFGASGRTITFPGLPAGLRRDRRRRGRWRGRRRRAPAAAPHGRPALDIRELNPGGHSTIAAAALHRAVADQGAGGPRHRPAVDLHVDHPHHQRARIRLAQGPGAGAVVGGVRGDRAARAALRPARRLRLHRRDGGPARRDRRRSAAAHGLAAQVLLRRRQRATGIGVGVRWAEEAGRRQPGVDRRPRDQLAADRDQQRTAGRSWSGSVATARTWSVPPRTARAPSAPTCPTSSPRTR